MSLRNTTFQMTSQDISVLGETGINSLRKQGYFKGYDFDIQPGKLYFTTRAISARVNRNYDGFPSQELKKSHHTFVGRPYFVNHSNDDHTRTRGIILGSRYIENGNDKYIELLCCIDSKAFPLLSKEIIKGNLDGVSMGCFIPGTKITLENGTKKNIEEIKLDDIVITHTGKTESVTYVMERPYQGLVYDIRSFAQSEPLILTPEHPIWVKRENLDRRFAQRRNVQIVDPTKCSCGREFENFRSLKAHIRESLKRNNDREHKVIEQSPEVSWIKAEDVRVGDWVLTPEYKCEQYVDYSFARLLGYYLAEGNMCWDRKISLHDPIGVEWTFNSNEDNYINEVINLISQMGYKPVGPYIKNNAATIRCNNKELANKFLEYGGKYSWNKELKSEVLGWDKENIKALVTAYFNGDGHYKNDHVEAGTASEKLAQQLYICAIKSGFSISPPKKQYSPSAKDSGRRPKYVLQCNIKDNDKILNRTIHIDESGLWRRVLDISIKNYEGNVYNFDVEGDDSYIASDVAVHNCDVHHTICSYCHNIALSPDDFCDHIKYLKGQTLERISSTGQIEDILVFEACYGINFFELSSVFDPADETALVQQILLPKLAAMDKVSYGETTAPPKVNTLREEGNCPQCGDKDFDGSQCAWCGYVMPPDELRDPDLNKAKQIDRGDNSSSTTEENPELDIDTDNENLQENSEIPQDIPQGSGGLVDAINETIQNLEGLFELEQVVQQFAQGISSPSIPSLPEEQQNLVPAQEVPVDTPQDFSGDIAENENYSIPPEMGDPSPPESTIPGSDSGEIMQEDPAEIAGNPMISEEPQEPADVGEEGFEEDPSQSIEVLQQQIQDLAEGVDQLAQQLSGQSDDVREEETPAMSKTKTSLRTPALSSDRADEMTSARTKLAELQAKLSDLSKNVGLADGEEAIADTPSAESGTSSTDAERNGQDFRTNVQDLDSNPATEDGERKPDKREPVEVVVRPVAKLGKKVISSIFEVCDKKYSEFDLGTGLAKAAYDYANENKLPAKAVLAQVLNSAMKNKSLLNKEDLFSLVSMREAFVRRVSENTDPYDMMSNKDNLETAKPDDRVDVERPVENDTNDYAQASQFDADKYDKNRGVDVAKPDDVHTMNWYPGEKPQLQNGTKPKESSVKKASAVDAIKLAETYIELGVISPDLKFDKVAEFEVMPKDSVLSQQFALDAVLRAQAAVKPRGIVPRSAQGQRPVAQMGRASSLDTTSSYNDDNVLLWVK